MLKKTAFVALLLISFSFSYSQTAKPSGTSWFKDFNFEHLDVSMTTGSMGISAEASSDVCDWATVRAGISWMPQIKTKMRFGIQIGDKEDDDKKFDENGNPVQTKFEKMAGFLEEITGYKIDEVVNMDCRAQYFHAKVMLDFKPFTNKDWHVTAGFFWGTKTMGRAVNSIEDMSTTMACGIYNSMYDKIDRYEPVFVFITLPKKYEDMIYSYGRMGMPLGKYKNPVYYEEDVVDKNNDVLHEKGELRFSAGDTYMMEPDEDGTVRAWAKVNSFKPYLGFGWSHQLKNYPEWCCGFEAGAVFWGGIPNVYTHDGTSLTKDVYDIDGKVGNLVSLVKAFPVFPLLEFKITRRIF